jgi:AraC-like DNA-binding protein
LQKRLILAQSLIREGLTMMDVSIQCGFNDYSNFVRAFKKNFDISPKKYSKQYKEKGLHQGEEVEDLEHGFLPQIYLNAKKLSQNIIN